MWINRYYYGGLCNYPDENMRTKKNDLPVQERPFINGVN